MNLEYREPTVFIICGKARSGKSTVSEYINKYYQDKSINLMYAGYIKEYTKKITGWDGSDETKPRTFLQQLGTEIIRNQIDENFFIKRMIDDIKIYSYFYNVITISDARFVDEIEIPRQHFKTIVIKIEKPNLVSGLTEEQLKHKSENALNDYNKYDYVINNDSTLESLEQKVFEILNKIKN